MTPKFVLEPATLSDSSGEELTRRQPPGAAPRMDSVHVGRLVRFDEDGAAIVDYSANPFLNPLRARSCVELSPGDVGCEVVLWFEAGDFAKPLVMGCVRTTAGAISPPSRDVEIDVESIIATLPSDDVRVSAVRSLTLRCGKASITLTREGRVVLNGSYVETRASGTNRIQGGSVRIN
jgi:hypothetical protein